MRSLTTLTFLLQRIVHVQSKIIQLLLSREIETLGISSEAGLDELSLLDALVHRVDVVLVGFLHSLRIGAIATFFSAGATTHVLLLQTEEVDLLQNLLDLVLVLGGKET